MSKETISFRFNCFKKDEIGAIPTLSKSIRGMQYGRQTITKAFNNLVPKDEYILEEKDDILYWLYSMSENNFPPEKMPNNPLKLRFQKQQIA